MCTHQGNMKDLPGVTSFSFDIKVLQDYRTAPISSTLSFSKPAPELFQVLYTSSHTRWKCVSFLSFLFCNSWRTDRYPASYSYTYPMHLFSP